MLAILNTNKIVMEDNKVRVIHTSGKVKMVPMSLARSRALKAQGYSVQTVGKPAQNFEGMKEDEGDGIQKGDDITLIADGKPHTATLGADVKTPPPIEKNKGGRPAKK